MSRGDAEAGIVWRYSAYAVAFAAPIILALAIGAFVLSIPAEEQVNIGGGSPIGRDTVATVAAGFANTMITLSGGLSLASVWVFRLPRRPTRRTLARIGFCAAMAVTVGAIYCGLRFQLDLSFRLSQEDAYPVELWRVLHWQGGLLLIQTGLLAVLGVDLFFNADKRSNAL